MAARIIRRVFSPISLFYYRLFSLRDSKLSMGANTVLLAKFLIKGKDNTIKFGKGCTVRNTTIQINGNNNEIFFADNVKVYENLKILIESSNCRLTINKACTIGSAKIQLGERNTNISIGEDCMLSRDIIINTSDFHSIFDIKSNTRINPAKDVVIGKHVWIGNGVYINKGAIINDNCVVAARSLVPGKSFENNTLIGGIPAKLIKAGINWNRKVL